MALEVGVNAYNDQTAANTYFTDRLHATEWSTFTEKDQALIVSTLIQDSLCIWDGDKTDSEQDLEFPRDGDTEVPNDILVANLEITLEIVKQGISSFVSKEVDLSKLKAGSVALDFLDPIHSVSLILNSVAKAKLSKYGVCSFGDPNAIRCVPLYR